MNEDVRTDPGRSWGSPGVLGGTSIDAADVDELERSAIGRFVGEPDAVGPEAEIGGGDDPPLPPEEGDHRPDRNWLAIILACLSIGLGVRAIFVGYSILKDEGILPNPSWI